MGDTVEVPTGLLAQVVERLTEKRTHLEKAVNTLGEAPSGLKDVFELCRGFERAFSNIVSETAAASRIKEAFFTEKGLAGQVQGLPLEKIFELKNVKKVCRVADGYQPHLVSPERGLRALASEALLLVEAPVKGCVLQVHNLLVSSARDAAASSGEYTESAMAGKVPLKCPEFKTFIMPAVVKALDDWRHEAERVAFMLVDMERSYITAGFFRYTLDKRYKKTQHTIALAKNLANANKKGFLFNRPKKNQGGELEVEQSQDSSSGIRKMTRQGSGGAPESSSFSNQSFDPADYIAAYFDKKVNEDSSRAALNISAWRWQRRFFVYSDAARTLYYFKNPDDVTNGKLKGEIPMSECVVEDLDEKGNLRKVVGREPVDQDRGSLLLRIRHKDPNKFAVKDHNAVVLRAESVAVKYEWLQRLGAGSGLAGPTPTKPAAPAPVEEAAGSRRASKDGSKTPAPNAPAPAAATPDGQANGVLSSDDEANGVAEDFDDIADPLEMWGANASLESLTETRLGEGSKFFRAENMREPDGRLLPAPPVVLTSDRLAMAKDKSTQETWEQRYDMLMDMFAQDMSIYIRMVCDTVVTTVPKAIIHCLVRKAEKGLLNATFAYVHKMTDEQLQRMLVEDDQVVSQRKLARQQLEDVRMAISDVQFRQEKLNRSEDKPEKIGVHAKILALASLGEYLSREQKQMYNNCITSPFVPELRPPVPLSHMNRPKKLPPAPGGAPEGTAPAVAARSSGGDLSRPSVQPPRRPPPASPPVNAARRTPPPPPKP